MFLLPLCACGGEGSSLNLETGHMLLMSLIQDHWFSGFIIIKIIIIIIIIIF